MPDSQIPPFQTTSQYFLSELGLDLEWQQAHQPYSQPFVPTQTAHVLTNLSRAIMHRITLNVAISVQASFPTIRVIHAPPYIDPFMIGCVGHRPPLLSVYPRIPILARAEEEELLSYQRNHSPDDGRLIKLFNTEMVEESRESVWSECPSKCSMALAWEMLCNCLRDALPVSASVGIKTKAQLINRVLDTIKANEELLHKISVLEHQLQRYKKPVHANQDSDREQ